MPPLILNVTGLIKRKCSNIPGDKYLQQYVNMFTREHRRRNQERVEAGERIEAG